MILLALVARRTWVHQLSLHRMPHISRIAVRRPRASARCTWDIRGPQFRMRARTSVVIVPLHHWKDRAGAQVNSLDMDSPIRWDPHFVNQLVTLHIP